MSNITDPPTTEVAGFDRNGVLVGRARRWDDGEKWAVTIRGQLRFGIGESDAREILQSYGAVTFRESDGRKG